MDQPIIIDNLDALKKRVAATGLGNHFNQQIEEHFAKGIPKFLLSASETMEGRRMDFELDINSKENKGYFNGFKATLHGEAESKVVQWFKSSDRITKEDAYLLLHDQQHPSAIHKTRYNEKGEKYGNWLQIDFTQKTEHGNNLLKRYPEYDLVEKLRDYSFLETSTPEQLLTAASLLADGRSLELTPINQKEHRQVVIRANPDRQTIHILDNAEGKYLFHDPFRTEAARARIQQENIARSAGTDESSSKEKGESLKSSHKPRIFQSGENTKGISM